MRFERDERGAVFVLVAVGTTALLGAGALAIDLGYLYMMKGRSQTTADAAALAAAQDLPDLDLARQAANRYAELNMPAGEYGDTLGDSDIELGEWDADARTFDGAVTGPDVNAVRVLNRQDGQQGERVSLFLARALGIEDAAVRSDAVASWVRGDETVTGCLLAVEPAHPGSLQARGNATIDNGPGCDVVACSSAYDTPPQNYSGPLAHSLDHNQTAAAIRGGVGAIARSCSANGQIATASGKYGFGVNGGNTNYCPEIGRVQCPVDPNTGETQVFEAARREATRIANSACNGGAANGNLDGRTSPPVMLAAAVPRRDTLTDFQRRSILNLVKNNKKNKNNGGGSDKQDKKTLDATTLDTDGDKVVCLDPKNLNGVKEVDFGSGYAYVVNGGDLKFSGGTAFKSGSDSTPGSLFVLSNGASISMVGNVDVQMRGFNSSLSPQPGWCGSDCDVFDDVIFIEEGSSTASLHKLTGNSDGNFFGASVMPNSPIRLTGTNDTGSLVNDDCTVWVGRTVETRGNPNMRLNTNGCDPDLTDEVTMNLLVPGLVQ